MKQFIGLMLLMFCMSIVTTTGFAIPDVPKTETIVKIEKAVVDTTVAFDVQNLKIAEVRCSHLIADSMRICSFNDLIFSTEKSKLTLSNLAKYNRRFIYRLRSNSIHRKNLPLKVGWHK